jgi:hypothetical protein
MKIENNTYYNGVYNRSNPTFSAIHPTRFFIKCEDGQFRQVTNSNTIKNRLQRKIVTWLNKATNDRKRKLEGKTVKVNKNENPEERNLRDRLVRFVLRHDKDYASRQEVTSIYLEPNGKFFSYLLTGDTVKCAGEGKPIGKVLSEIKTKQDFMRTYYGYSNEQARSYITPNDEKKLKQVKEDYFRQSETAVRNLMANQNVDKSYLDLYFEPIIGKRSKTPKGFKLINAAFKNFMNS